MLSFNRTVKQISDIAENKVAATALRSVVSSEATLRGEASPKNKGSTTSLRGISLDAVATALLGDGSINVSPLHKPAATASRGGVSLETVVAAALRGGGGESADASPKSRTPATPSRGGVPTDALFKALRNSPSP